MDQNSTENISKRNSRIMTNRLHHAITKNNFEEVKRCIKNGAVIDLTGNINAVILAAQFGRKKILEYLLNLGADVDCSDLMGATPLMWASYSDSTKVANMLLEYGADINLPDTETGATPLIWWVVNSSGEIDKVANLVEQGADIFYRDGNNKNCLDYAVENCCVDLVEYLKEEQKRQTELKIKLSNKFEFLKRLATKVKKKSIGYILVLDDFRRVFKDFKNMLTSGINIDDYMVYVLKFCAEYFQDDDIRLLCNNRILYKRRRSRAITNMKAIKREREKSIDN